MSARKKKLLCKRISIRHGARYYFIAALRKDMELRILFGQL